MKRYSWRELAGWLNIEPEGIKSDCSRDGDLAQCCRRKLVEVYCDSTAKSPQQVAEDIAEILEDEMSNKRAANELRMLIDKLGEINQ